jgi:hypothetical protein
MPLSTFTSDISQINRDLIEKAMNYNRVLLQNRVDVGELFEAVADLLDVNQLLSAKVDLVVNGPGGLREKRLAFGFLSAEPLSANHMALATPCREAASLMLTELKAVLTTTQNAGSIESMPVSAAVRYVAGAEKYGSMKDLLIETLSTLIGTFYIATCNLEDACGSFDIVLCVICVVMFVCCGCLHGQFRQNVPPPTQTMPCVLLGCRGALMRVLFVSKGKLWQLLHGWRSCP